MSQLLKATYLSIITCTIIYLAYAWFVFQVFGVGYFTGPDALVRIGKSIGILIIAGYAFEILVQFCALIIATKRSGKKITQVIVDERDKQINYRALSISLYVLCTGLFLAIGALAMGWAPFWVFHIIVLFFALANATELSSKIYFYRRGF